MRKKIKIQENCGMFMYGTKKYTNSYVSGKFLEFFKDHPNVKKPSGTDLTPAGDTFCIPPRERIPQDDRVRDDSCTG